MTTLQSLFEWWRRRSRCAWDLLADSSRFGVMLHQQVSA
jgi:hypothetical protein